MRRSALAVGTMTPRDARFSVSLVKPTLAAAAARARILLHVPSYRRWKCWRAIVVLFQRMLAGVVRFPEFLMRSYVQRGKICRRNSDLCRRKPLAYRHLHIRLMMVFGEVAVPKIPRRCRIKTKLSPRFLSLFKQAGTCVGCTVLSYCLFL